VKSIRISNQEGSVHLIFIVTVVVILLGAICFLFWNNFFRSHDDNVVSKPQITSTSSKPINLPANIVANDDNTLTIKGQLTKKQTSCGGVEVLKTDGTVSRSGDLCDGSTTLLIGEVAITSGSEVSNHTVTDVGGVHPGEDVEVRYVGNESKGSTNNCASCYVKLQNTRSNKARQWVN
jgi:hypothetical protein